MQPCAPSLKPLLLWLLLPWLCAGQLQVQGPRSPVIALVGEAAVLPCHLSPPADARNMEIRWYRDGRSMLVHEYRDSQDHTEQQSLQYIGRTELLRDSITQGQVALRIHPIIAGDEGDYSCVFVSSTELGQTQFELRVAALGAAPLIHVQPAQTGHIMLTCMSLDWYPDPELQWKDLQGRLLSPDSERMSVQEYGLVHVESSVTVEESSRAEVSCSIRNLVLREEKEARLSVAEALFPRVSSWIVALAMLLVLLAVTLVTTGVLLLRSRKAREGVIEELERTAKDLEQRQRFIKHCLREARQFAEDIVLDEDTAHPQLAVSEAGKRVECLPREQPVPENPGRFTSVPAVLGQSNFSTGNHYWEVEVGENDRWMIGVCSYLVNREIQFKSIHPLNGFWCINRYYGNYKAFSRPHCHFKVVAPPSVVGIFVQYEEGLISFYDVKNFTILHSFASRFSQPLKPCFFPGPFTLRHHPVLCLPPVPPPDESDPLWSTPEGPLQASAP